MVQDRKKVGCQDCGLILNKPFFDVKHQFHCPRCNAVIHRFGQNENLVIIMTITTLILFIPTIFLPLLTLTILDIEQTTSLIQTLSIFINDGYVLLSIFVVFIGILIPFILLTLIIFLLLKLKTKQHYPKILNLYKELSEWQMAEVALVSVFIAIIKLQKMAELHIEIGLFFYVLFLFMMILTQSLFNSYDIWRQYETSDR